MAGSSRHGPDPTPDSRRDEVFDEFVQRINDGEAFDRQDLFTHHPDVSKEIADDLELYAALDSNGHGSPSPLGTLGDYTLRRQIGRGGMGVVYEAWENSMDRAVALKVLPPGVAVDDKAFSRFMREARSAGRLSHPNVVSVHSMGQVENTPYYAMEYVEGETLAQVLRRLKEAEPDEDGVFGKKHQVGYFANIANNFADVADGLQHAHSKGVIHRDIKPSNLILDADGRLRILDFGLAQLEGQESLTISGDVVGTPAYMSPEQARRRKIPIDHRTDVYSLGATLYELLTHQAPFRGKDHNDTLSLIVERDPQPPRQLFGKLPRDLETIVLKCLRKDVSDRYGTAEALAQDLRRFVRGDPIEARPEGRFDPFYRSVRRHRVRIAIASLLVSLAIATAILTALQRKESARRDLADYTEGVVRSSLVVQLPGLAHPTADVGAARKRNWGIRSQILFAPDVTGIEAEVEGTLQRLATLEQLLPHRPEAYYQSARALLVQGRTRKAIAKLEQALKHPAGFYPAERLLESLTQNGSSTAEPSDGAKSPGWKQALADGYRKLRARDYAAAAEAFTEIISLCEQGKEPYLGAAVEAYLARGRARTELGRPLAIADFEAVRARWPDALEPALLQAEATYRLGYQGAANRLLADTFERSSHPDDTCIWIVHLYFQLGDLGRCHVWVDRLTSGVDKIRMRAVLYQSEGKTADAVASAEEALKLEPANPQNFEALAFVLDRHDHRRAVEVLEEGLRLHPDHPELKHRLSKALFRRSRFEEGERLCRELLATTPERWTARESLAGHLFRQGRVTESLKEYETVAREHPECDRVDLGWATFCLGRLSDSQAALEYGHRLDPEDAFTARVLALVHARQGRPELGLELLEDPDALIPRAHWTYHNLARLREQMDDTTGAFEAYAEAFRLRANTGLNHERLCELLRSPSAQIPADRLSIFLEQLVSSHEEHPTNAATAHLIALSLLRSKPAEVEQALELAAKAAATAKHDGIPEAQFLTTLAQAHYRNGDAPAAIAALERATTEPHATRSTHRLLEQYRRAALPWLSSCASVDWWRSAGVRSPSLADFSEERIDLYHRGVQLLETEDFEAATSVFQRLVERDTDTPEPLLRLAEALTGLGRREETLEVVADGLVRFPRDVRFWREWIKAWSEQSDQAVEEIATRRDALADAPPNRGALALLDDLLWLATGLRSNATLRINCGGGPIARTAAEPSWRRDGFFRDGWLHVAFEEDHLGMARKLRASHWTAQADFRRFHDTIEGAAPIYVYQTNRWFRPEAAVAGYSIPVPAGDYRVTLHLAEVWYRARDLRRFSIAIEGEDLVVDLDPFDIHGFATAFTLTKKVCVADGLLDITLSSKRGPSLLAGIEVQGTS